MARLVSPAAPSCRRLLCRRRHMPARVKNPATASVMRGRVGASSGRTDAATSPLPNWERRQRQSVTARAAVPTGATAHAVPFGLGCVIQTVGACCPLPVRYDLNCPVPPPGPFPASAQALGRPVSLGDRLRLCGIAPHEALSASGGAGERRRLPTRSHGGEGGDMDHNRERPRRLHGADTADRGQGRAGGHGALPAAG
jgi:hypothetical protein